MKHSKMKKILSLIMSLTILVSCVLPAFASWDEYPPVIYISGIEDSVLFENPDKYSQEVVFDMSSNDFLSAATKIFAGIYLSKEGINQSEINKVVEGINDIFSPIACSKTGDSQNSLIGAGAFPLALSQYLETESVFSDNVKAFISAASMKLSKDKIFVFTYDWRLSPDVNAEKLRLYAEAVIRATKADKAAIVAEGYGGIVANAYLYKYPTHAAQNIETCVFLDCPLEGNALMGDIMKGKIAKTADDTETLIGKYQDLTGSERGEALLAYLQDDPSGAIANLFSVYLGRTENATLISQLIKLLAFKILDEANIGKVFGKAYNNFTTLCAKTVYSSCLAEYLRNMPGLWAMVPEKDQQKALTFLFKDAAPTNVLLSKIESAFEITNNAQITLKKARENGIKTYVVANYGIQILPGTISMNDVSDGLESVKYASAGAGTAECPTDWPHNDNCANRYHDHLSPDGDINASFCALPENTWFIKDVPCRLFTEPAVASFIVWLATSEEQRTIRDTADYTQYMTYSKYSHSLVPYTGTELKPSMQQAGDVTQDGVISPADARQVLRYSVGLETPSLYMKAIADVDGSGIIEPADARLVLRYAVGLISNFPVN